jgi:uncharacterized integral membrane protein
MTDDRSFEDGAAEPTPPDIESEAERSEEQAPPTAPAPVTEPSLGIPWRLGLFLLLAVVVVIFAVQNTQDVELQFLGWSWQLPLVIIITITVVVSVLLDEILGGIIRRSQRKRRMERRELKRLRSEQ